MFNVKYNLLVILQIILGIINYILLLRVFGISNSSDAYLLATSSITVLFAFILIPIGQFMPFYNDLKVKSLKKAHDFYNVNLNFAILYGLLLFIIVNIFISLIIKLFAFNIDSARYYLLKNILQILSFSLIFYPINQINEQLFNAEMRFSVPYILSIIPLSLITLTQIMMLKLSISDISYLAIAQSVGYLGIAIFGSIYVSKTLIKYKMIFSYKQLFEPIKNSCIMKSGAFIWNVSSSVLFNNFLVLFPMGYVSLFYYSKKILDIVNSFTLGPSIKMLNSNISKLIAQKNRSKIIQLSKKMLFGGGIIFILALIGAYFIQTPILKFVSGNKLSSNDLQIILLIFLILCPWYILMFINTPFVAIVQFSKKAKETLLCDLTFLCIISFSLFVLKNYFGIYTIGIATFLAQLFNFSLYIIFTQKSLQNL